MANPNNAVGTNGAFGGRTSVNAFNDVLSAFSGRGILSGWACSPSSGLTVQLGGDGETRDVAIAEDASGNKTTVNNISQSPVEITIPSAPASNSRIDLVVAYIEDSPNGSGETDNYDVVNLLVVSGTVSSTPVAPTDRAIRTAITADGASGATAYYVVLAQITIATGTTDIDSTMISAGANATLLTSKIGTGSVTADMIDFKTCAMHIYYAVLGTDVSFIAEEDMYVEVEALTGFTWGYSGGIRSLDVNVHNGLTQLFNRSGGLSGGDTTGRQMSLHALYRTTKNTECTLNVAISGSGGGAQSGNDYYIVKCYKIAQLG